MTKEGDVVLVYMEGKPAFFARIEAVTPDSKPDWYQVKMLVLQVPLVVITWILRHAYINGEEFTMGGRPMKMVKVVSPEKSGEEESSLPKGAEPEIEAANPESGGEKRKVISLADRRKKEPTR
ncbi:MAG: hypothetical protein KBH99_07245 [Syntrophobacteraceae bacterium]|nr:hypothetical protein [Syntrophobacteraceae bacterium]